MEKGVQCLVVVLCLVAVSVFVNVDATENVEAGNVAQTKFNETEIVEISPDVFKKLMWKKCSNSSYVACAKLALVYVIEKLDFSENLILMPGVSLLRRDDDSSTLSSSNLEEIVVRQDFNKALDRYLIEKLRRYLGSLSISVKLLDKNTIDDMRSLGETFGVSPTSAETGRGKKKYMHSLLMAGWMSGATLLALTMKTIAILSGKAMLAALLSLMLSVISAFGKHHGELKSTTYEIITKPIVSHSHSTDVHEAHASELSPAYAYKRSIPAPEVIIKADSASDIEHIIRKIRDHAPYYAPVAVEYSKT